MPAAWRSSGKIEDDATIPGEVRSDRTNPQIRTQPAYLRAIRDGLARTVLLIEQAGKPVKYNRLRQSKVVFPSEGAWATAEFSSIYAAGVNVDNLSGLYGFHAGANVAMGDGSIHLFTESMEMEVVTALLSREGDEIIDTSDWQ